MNAPRRRLTVRAIAMLSLLGVAGSVAACGNTVPTSPGCPKTAANFKYTDTVYVVGTSIIFGFFDVYSCGGVDVGQRRTP